MSDRFYVVAGDAHQARTWGQINHVSSHRIVIVTRPEYLCGLRGQTVVLVGTYWERRDYDEISTMLRAQEAVVLKAAERW